MTRPPAWCATPEDELLALCARGGQERDWDTALWQVRDWEGLRAALFWHRLTPLFLQGAQPFADSLPPAWWAEMRREGAALVGGGLALLLEAGAALEALQRANIRAFYFKGAALSLMAYGSPTLRAFGDVDLLVSPADVPRARATLKEASGAVRFPDAPLYGAVPRAWRQRMAYEVPLTTGGAILDLHWAIAPPCEGFPYDFETLWARRYRLETPPLRGVATLGGEELVASLCFHGLKHAWEHVEWIGALARITAAREIAWGELLHHTHATGTERVILLGAALVEDLGARSVPAAVRFRIAQDKTVRGLARDIWHNTRGPKPDARTRFSRRFVMGLQARTGLARTRFATAMSRQGVIYAATK